MKGCLFLIVLIFSIVHCKERPAECLLRPALGQNSYNNDNETPNRDKSSRIAGGNEASLGQFPWHVHMNLYDDIDLKICGGALINPKWVLTSGMCIVCASSAILYFGITDRLNFSIPWMTHVTSYDHFIVHENYDIMNFEDPFADNIGLVFLQRGGDFLLDIPNINTIQLPIEYRDNDFLGTIAIATGFGATEDPPTHSSPLLRYVDMNVISNEACNQTYQGAITDTKLCTDTTGGRSTCHGDFGAPLAARMGAVDILIGVGSLRWFEGCQLGAPAVFTRVTDYLDWIEDNTSEEPEDSIYCNCDCICNTCPSVETRKTEL